MSNRAILTSPLFILSLAILVINDFYLKQHCPGLISGKLSDFSGLFAFYLFCLSFVRIYHIWIGIIISAFFIYWKSEYSSELIILLNSFGSLRIGRTIDYSDLIALSVLPAAFYYSKVISCGAEHKYFSLMSAHLQYALYIVSPIIFIADNVRESIQSYDEYRIESPVLGKYQTINDLNIPGIKYDKDTNTFIYKYSMEGNTAVRIHAFIRERDGSTLVIVDNIYVNGAPDYPQKKLLERFEADVLSRIGAGHTLINSTPWYQESQNPRTP